MSRLPFLPVVVVASSTGRRVLFGGVEGVVATYDLAGGALHLPYKTIFDSGIRRLALSDEIDGVVAAAYHVHGMALYSARSGAELWRRRDIKKVQRISLSREGLAAYCGRERGPLAIVDLRTGETIEEMRGARALYDSKFDGVRLVDRSRPQLQAADGRRLFYIERSTFAIIDVVFAPGCVVLTEAGGPVRCIDVATGRERWRHDSADGYHVVHLSYRESDRAVLGVGFSFRDGGSMSDLWKWSLEDGAPAGRFKLPDYSADSRFALGGEALVTTRGVVIDPNTRGSCALA